MQCFFLCLCLFFSKVFFLVWDLKKFFFVLVLVVPSASVERISVSCVQDFLFNQILLEIFDHPIYIQTTMRELKRHCGFQPIKTETFDGKF